MAPRLPFAGQPASGWGRIPWQWAPLESRGPQNTGKTKPPNAEGFTDSGLPKQEEKSFSACWEKLFLATQSLLGWKTSGGSPQGLQAWQQREKWNDPPKFSWKLLLPYTQHRGAISHTPPHFPTAPKAQPMLPDSTHSPAQATDHTMVLAQLQTPAHATSYPGPALLLSGHPVPPQPGVLKSDRGRGCGMEV